MKLKIKYYVGVLALILLYLLYLKNWNLETFIAENTNVKSNIVRSVKKHSAPKEREITFVFRYTHDTSKHLIGTVNAFVSQFPSNPIIIVSDTILPREVVYAFSNTTKIINVPLKLDLLNLIIDRNVANYIKTKYLFIVPAGVLSLQTSELLTLVYILKKERSTFVGIPVEKKPFRCLKLELNLLQWSISYKFNEYDFDCDAIHGDHGIFMFTNTLRKIAEPFMLPFPEALYIQTSIQSMVAEMIQSVRFKSKHKEARRNDLILKNQLHRQLMNKQLKIKKVVRENGVVEWYGCTRNTQRCFPNVVNLVPEYLNQGRWTPPCCLKVLRLTVHHVFKVLKEANVTFWLEGGSLLGAMRAKDIIPWDYDVDIGIYLEDIDKCSWLKSVRDQKPENKKQLPSVVDKEGFVWEKASPEEGDFYRVQASEHNRLHVDIFPFYSKDGIMTKKTWFANHPQDKEFPEYYLKPLTTIEFAGTEAPAPNNVKEFLELKFGKGCVENPQYPNPKLFPFPNQAKSLVVNETFYDAGFSAL